VADWNLLLTAMGAVTTAGALSFVRAIARLTFKALSS
jgi:hypothetical protein